MREQLLIYIAFKRWIEFNNEIFPLIFNAFAKEGIVIEKQISLPSRLLYILYSLDLQILKAICSWLFDNLELVYRFEADYMFDLVV